MLKEFIAHIQKTTQPFIQEVNGSTFVHSTSTFVLCSFGVNL